eukprot:TRINITY_DN4162_c0_g3_i1.p1 TRINITY_DN4162_c0_g3~~TRINITY_DN4162_c0_g3_i1.p1  ORF type:complete len:273 (-),score=100.06 TRINITY_DN4162_c0_g3_i1:42-860(-)
MLMYHGGGILPLLFFSFLMAVVLYCFAGYHVYLVVKNTTTSETFKWADLHGDISYAKDALLQLAERDKLLNQAKQRAQHQETASKKRKQQNNDPDTQHAPSAQQQEQEQQHTTQPVQQTTAEAEAMMKKSPVALLASSVPLNIRKTLFAKTDIDIAEFSEEYQESLRTKTPKQIEKERQALERAKKEADNNSSAASAQQQQHQQQTRQKSPRSGEGLSTSLRRMTEDEVSVVLVAELKRLSRLEPKNAFDQGLLQNLLEVLYPRSKRIVYRS